jgi:hypothetical protein
MNTTESRKPILVTEARDWSENLVQIECTWEGTDKYGDPTSPWVFRDDIDQTAPILECDVHGQPAQWVVYESSDTGPFVGPCQHYLPVDLPAGR